MERLNVSIATARVWANIAEKLLDLPQLAEGLAVGELSVDKVRAVVDTATPETDLAVRAQAKECSVRELAAAQQVLEGRVRGDGTCRLREALGPLQRHLPYGDGPASARLLRRGQGLSGGAGPPDPFRRRDPLGPTLRRRLPRPDAGRPSHRGATNHYVVVAHVPLAALADETSELAGELERDGLISSETVRRIACDATVAIAVDDDVGHTMYEGRARRFPTDAQRREIMRRDRHCRFPRCTNVTFTNVHHLKPWGMGGPTDLHNLVLLCEFHHHRVHSRGWTTSGDANRGADIRRAERKCHDVAPVAAVDDCLHELTSSLLSPRRPGAGWSPTGLD